MYYDYSYLIFVLPAVLLSLWASTMVKGRFARYNKVNSKRNITGAQAAQYLLKVNGITDVKIAHISGNLTDNYNPQTKVLSLSDSTINSTSIAAIGVAAHETGHAIQHATGYKPLGLRRSLVPAANIGSQVGPALVILGLIASSMAKFAAYSQILLYVSYTGVALFSLSVLFYLITLPVEFNASHRALKILDESNVLDEEELKGTKKVLGAAAMTYVASALAAIGSLLRFLFILNNNKRRR